MPTVLCQATGCTAEVTQSVSVHGDDLGKLICPDRLCLSWAKSMLEAQRPGAVLVCEPLPLLEQR